MREKNDPAHRRYRDHPPRRGTVWPRTVLGQQIDPRDPNIGAGMAMGFAEIFGVVGLGVLVVWAIAALVVRLQAELLHAPMRGHGLS